MRGRFSFSAFRKMRSIFAVAKLKYLQKDQRNSIPVMFTKYTITASQLLLSLCLAARV